MKTELIRKIIVVASYIFLIVCVCIVIFNDLFIQMDSYEYTIYKSHFTFSSKMLFKCFAILIAYIPMIQYGRNFNFTWKDGLLLPIFKFERNWLNIIHLPLSLICLILTPILVPLLTICSFPISEGVYVDGDQDFLFILGAFAAIFVYGGYLIIYVVRKYIIF